MKLIRTMMVGVLGTATLLPALPAWAESGPAGTASPAAPTQATTAKPAEKPAAATPGTAAEPPAATVGGPAKRPVAGDVSLDNGADSRMLIRRNNRKAFLDARLAALHAGLELTPAQEALWHPVDEAIRALVEARHALRSHRRSDSDTTMSGTDRLKARGAGLVAVGQAMGKLADAAGPLLRMLNPDQKQRLPILLHGLRPHRAVALAFGIDQGFGRHWRHRFMRDGMGGRFDPFADRFGGPRHGDGWRNDGWSKDGWRGDNDRFGSPGGPSGDGWHHRHHEADAPMDD